MASPADILRSAFERASSNINTPIIINADIAQFLEAYQRLLLAEPESAVRQPLKEAFLALRIAAETAYIYDESEAE